MRRKKILGKWKREREITWTNRSDSKASSISIDERRWLINSACHMHIVTDVVTATTKKGIEKKSRENLLIVNHHSCIWSRHGTHTYTQHVMPNYDAFPNQTNWFRWKIWIIGSEFVTAIHFMSILSFHFAFDSFLFCRLRSIHIGIRSAFSLLHS